MARIRNSFFAGEATNHKETFLERICPRFAGRKRGRSLRTASPALVEQFMFIGSVFVFL